jgi:uncharacterized membrane protein HdeD (DUF308 family)
MPETGAYSEELRELTRLWWLTLGVGLLSIAAGIIVLAKPGDSLSTIAVIVGIFIALDGVVVLLSSLRHGTQNRGLAALIGIVSFVVGVLLIRHPVAGVTAVALLVGIWLIAIGAVRLVLAFDREAHRVWYALVALIELIAGIAIVSSPGIGIATLAILVGIALIVNGAGLTVLGVVLHGAREQASAPQRAAHVM